MEQPFTDNTLMPFGTHKDKKLANVPAEYLIYIYENFNLNSKLKAYIKDNLDTLKQEIKDTQK